MSPPPHPNSLEKDDGPQQKLTYQQQQRMHLINSFHTLKGAKDGSKIYRLLLSSRAVATALSSDGCGFASFPVFVLNRGMITSYMVNAHIHTRWRVLSSWRSQLISCTLTASIFAFAIAINVVTELLKRYETKYKIYMFVPNSVAMEILFYLGSYFVIDMCIGSLILFGWKLWNKQQTEDLAPAIASGLICGESMWGVPAAILSLANVKAPICMKFFSNSDNHREK